MVTTTGCRDIAAFFAAVRDGRRNEWVGRFFSPQYPTKVGDEGIVHDIITFHSRRVSLSVAECEQCGRLWVQRGPEVNAYRSWAPDEPGYVGVLRAEPADGAEPNHRD
jgi:hypothetical protein